MVVSQYIFFLINSGPVATRFKASISTTGCDARSSPVGKNFPPMYDRGANPAF